MNFHRPLYAPDESSSTLWLERAMMAGANLSFVGYGVVASLFFLCVSYLKKDVKSDRGRVRWLLAYAALLFVLCSIVTGVNMRFDELAYIDKRNFPGGPAAYGIEENGITINIIGSAASFASSWLQDGLLLYRFYIIWGPRRWILGIPTTLYLLSIVLSCFLLVQLCIPGATLWHTSSVDFGLAYWSATLANNVLTTVLIVARLAHMRRQVTGITGNFGGAHSPYLTVSAILIESSALYSVFLVPFMVLFAQKNPGSLLLFTLQGVVQCMAPLLIILRVAQGRACTRAAVVAGDTDLHPTASTRRYSSPVFAPAPLQSAMKDMSSIIVSTLDTRTYDGTGSEEY